ncbi:TIM-barrel domain-containing protein [Lacimicrobium sp. SS2-24]|uniref:TIM-barrel domain-containing protein n=1 Tax=Lacimicrobium sp. SS2-24 TaxID=2005569 RepID=UPI000B4B05B7|nr:TIM-barrel domain-containing protein [Lacimicrobium sp. SS2-24]
MKRFTTLFFLWLWCLPLQAAELVSHHLQHGTLILNTSEGSVTLTPYGEGAFEVFYEPDDVAQLPSFAIAEDASRSAGTLTTQGDKLVFSHGDLRAVISPSPVQIAYYQGERFLLAEEKGLFVHPTLRGFRFRLSESEKLLGGGQRVLGMDRRGQRLPMYNKAHYGYTTESRQMYYSLPAVFSSHNYILAFDNSASGHLDLGHNEKDVLQFEAVSGRTAYLIAAGQHYADTLSRYVEVTGHQPMVPRWALGNYASRFGYRTEAQTRKVVALFQEQQIPLDAVILDLFWFGSEVKGMMGNLDWDRQAFPEPEQMIEDFSEQGVKTILITEPFVLSTSDKWEEAVNAGALAKNLAGEVKRFDFYFGNTGLIDVFDPVAQDWFWQTYDRLLEQGVGGWWGDLGEPEVHPADTLHRLSDGRVVSADEIHNAYGHQWAKMVFERHRQARPDERPFIMMRSGFVGSQRYGMIPWTGDVSRSWGGLKPQVELSLSMGLLGLGYTHSDLGGFAGGEQFDAELYTRWLQYGVFQPVYRPHAQENIAPEPVFHDARTRDIVREFIRLRYAMLPYNYTLSYLNSQKGIPLMRPLFFAQPQNTALMDNKDSYFWGDAFLVTPVTEPGVDEVNVTLPEGVWFDYFTGKRYEGGKVITQPTSIETLPVLVKAGSFVPMVEPVLTTKDYSPDALILHYYHDPSVQQGQGLMYEDDGSTFDAVAKREYEILSFSAKQHETSLDIVLQREGFAYAGMPEQREITLTVHNWPKRPDSVTLNGQKVAIYDSYQQALAAGQGCWWDNQGLSVRFSWDHHKKTISIR